jgi:hypothetical protein
MHFPGTMEVTTMEIIVVAAMLALGVLLVARNRPDFRIEDHIAVDPAVFSHAA